LGRRLRLSGPEKGNVRLDATAGGERAPGDVGQDHGVLKAETGGVSDGRPKSGTRGRESRFIGRDDPSGGD